MNGRPNRARPSLDRRLLGLCGNDVLLTTLPLFHTNAFNTFYQALLTGAALVVEPRLSASGFAASLSRHGANVTYLLGAMVPILLSRPPSELDRAHHVRIALGPGVPRGTWDRETDMSE
jgi:carnitine-CoA ligase